MKDKRLTVLVSGQVQGVGYRAFTRQYAKDNQLAGYAENLGDGRVEVVAEGNEVELEALLHQLKRGPTHARVTQVEVMWSDATGLASKDFYVY